MLQAATRSFSLSFKMTNTNTADFIASLPTPLTLRGEGRSDRATVVKRIRADLALALKTGALPTGTKLSIRDWVRVEIVAWQGAVFSDGYTAHLLDPNGTPWDGRRSERFSPALCTALKLIESIANLHNYDDSRIEVDYFSVGYYLTVDARTVEAAASQGIELERNPALAELQTRAAAAATALGAKCVRSVLGPRRTIANSCEWSLALLIKIADRADGRPVAYDKRRGAWLPL